VTRKTRGEIRGGKKETQREKRKTACSSPRYSIYLLYWYKRTNTGAKAAGLWLYSAASLVA